MNPGGLYGGLTVEQIMKKRVSKRRNEVIAGLFHRVHFVEKWGRGIELIQSKEPKTTFEVVADIFITTFLRKNLEVVDAPVKRLPSYKKRYFCCTPGTGTGPCHKNKYYFLERTALLES